MAQEAEVVRLVGAVFGDRFLSELLGELETDTRNVLLMLARIRMTVSIGEIAAEEDWTGVFRDKAAVPRGGIYASGG